MRTSCRLIITPVKAKFASQNDRETTVQLIRCYFLYLTVLLHKNKHWRQAGVQRTANGEARAGPAESATKLGGAPAVADG